MIKRSTLVMSAVLAAATLGTAPAPAAAQSIDSPYRFIERSQEIWLFGSRVYTDRGTIDIGPGSGYAGGIGYSIRVNGPFAFDGRISYFPTTRRVYDAPPVDDTAAVREDPMVGLERIGTAELSLLLIDASLRFNVTGPRTWYRLQPYALIGAGGALRVASDNAGEEDLPSDSDRFVRFRNGFTGHVGAGIEWHATQRVTLRFDARDVLWRLDVPEGFFNSGRILDNQQWVQTAHLNLGLAVRF